MTKTPSEHDPDASEPEPARQSSVRGLKLLRHLLAYHALVAMGLVSMALLFPSFLEHLPLGGVRTLAESAEVTVAQVGDGRAETASTEVVGSSLARATNGLDRLGYARRLVIVVLGVSLLMLPVSWVRKGVNGSSTHDHSLDETTLILPGVVAVIVTVVQHSLPLAFSLAGIIAGVQFRRALQDTFDALFILVAIGAGIAAGVEALEIAAVLTVFFCYATLYVQIHGDGLESDFEAQKKLQKRLRKAADGHAAQKTVD